MNDELKQRRDALGARLEAIRVERQRNEPDRPGQPYNEPQYDPAFDYPGRLTPLERVAAALVMAAFFLFLFWLGPG